MPVIRITRRKGVSLLQPMTPAARAFVAAVNEARATGKQRRKYGNKPQVMDGRKFDSMKEARRYVFLRERLRMGEIEALDCQPKLELRVNDIDCGDYIADFAYVIVATGAVIWEDVKSSATRKNAVYQLKRKLVKAIYNIEIVEV